MKKITFLASAWLCAISLMACSGSVSEDVHGDPVKMMETIFDAAKTNDFSKLNGLCTPTGEGDRDVKMICNLASETDEMKKEFVSYFSTGRVLGPATITENEATVRFSFGPDGSREEEMNFVKVDGKWYLSSF